MTLDGFYNEKDFINYLNNKRVGEVNSSFLKMLKKVYSNNLNSNSYIKCQKSFKTDKADIIIIIDGIKKYISIKSGKNNSIHLEKLDNFLEFLKENGISNELIKIYVDYHYGLDELENRQSAKDYQLLHEKDIEKFNIEINKPNILKKAINRFLFKGLYNYNNLVDALIYGKIDNFICITREEVTRYLITKKDKFNSIHFSSLTLQPWTRNLNYNPKYEYRRDYVQVKWYRLENIIEEILSI